MSSRRKALKKSNKVFGRHKFNRKKAVHRRLERKHYAPCVECGGHGEPVKGDVIYPERPQFWSRLYYRCKCGAYVGSHVAGGHPLGYPAGPLTRRARVAAHAAFDPLWRAGLFASRDAAYTWLAEQTGIDTIHCHISKLGRDDALRVTRLCLKHWNDHATDDQKAAKAQGSYKKQERKLAKFTAQCVKEAAQGQAPAEQNGVGKVSSEPRGEHAVSSQRPALDGASCHGLRGPHGPGEPHS